MRAWLAVALVVGGAAAAAASEESAPAVPVPKKRTKKLHQHKAEVVRHVAMSISRLKGKEARQEEMVKHFDRFQEARVDMPLETAFTAVHMLHGHERHEETVFEAGRSLATVAFGDDHLDHGDPDRLRQVALGILNSLKNLGCASDSVAVAQTLASFSPPSHERLESLKLHVPSDCFGEWPHDYRNGLRVAPLWNVTKDLPFLDAFVDSYTELREELDAYIARGGQFDPIHGYLASGGVGLDKGLAWQQVALMYNGKPLWNRECHWFPTTCKFLDGLPQAKLFAAPAWSIADNDTYENEKKPARRSGNGMQQGLHAAAFLYRLRAGAPIPPHFGRSNQMLYAHLGLRLPQGQAGSPIPTPRLRVGNETQEWKEGAIYAFADSFRSEVFWGDPPTEEERKSPPPPPPPSDEEPEYAYYLAFSFLHPDLWPEHFGPAHQGL